MTISGFCVKYPKCVICLASDVAYYTCSLWTSLEVPYSKRLCVRNLKVSGVMGGRVDTGHNGFKAEEHEGL